MPLVSSEKAGRRRSQRQLNRDRRHRHSERVGWVSPRMGAAHKIDRWPFRLSSGAISAVRRGDNIVVSVRVDLRRLTHRAEPQTAC
jgi:hypothetical protein